MTIAGPVGNAFIVATGPTGKYETVNVLATGPTGVAGSEHRFKTYNQLTGPTGASGPTGTFKTFLAAATGLAGKRTIIVPGYSGGGGGGGGGLPWNPLDIAPGGVLSDTNHLFTIPNTNTTAGVRGVTSHASGKWYLEYSNWVFGNLNDKLGFAMATHDLTQYSNVDAFGIQPQGGFLDGGTTQLGTMSPTGHLQIAIDIDGGHYWARYDGGTWAGAGTPADPTAGTNGAGFTSWVPVSTAVFPWAEQVSFLGAVAQTAINTGDRAFANPPPTGYLPWG